MHPKPELLSEVRQFSPKKVSNKDAGEDGNVFVEGILATVEEKNGNGRYYPRELWVREIAKFQEKIAQKTTETCGELDHPDSPIINLKNASHAIRKVWWDGNRVMGILEIFSSQGKKGNEVGRMAGTLIANDLTIGISSRGMGSLKQNGNILEVQDDFELLTWDIVSNPSNHNSWMSQVKGLNESQEYLTHPYEAAQNIITEILCSSGTCPIF
tara:strand:- start:3598 stop:4236 length:639 start_codon:yes stop_codon:yes gene_type:complete